MKKLFALFLVLITTLTSSSFADETAKNYKLPNLGKLNFTAVVTGKAINYSAPLPGGFVRYNFLDGDLVDITVIEGDLREFMWPKEEGHITRGNPKNYSEVHAVLLKHLEKIKLPPIKIDTAQGTAEAEPSFVKTGTPLTYTYVGSQFRGGTNDTLVVVKASDGEIITFPESDQLFPFRGVLGNFRIGEKIGKLFPLIEKDGEWIIPVRDFYPKTVSTTK